MTKQRMYVKVSLYCSKLYTRPLQQIWSPPCVCMSGDITIHYTVL